MKTYKSRVGKIVFLNFFVMLIVILNPLHESTRFSWLLSIVGMLFLVEYVIRILTTSYVIDNKTLLVKSGIWVNKKIDIGSIRKISRTDDIGTSAAFAPGSLRIMYGDAKQVIISPKNNQQFLEDITNSRPELLMVG